jgi:predicted RNase H-like HicB family nuclease
MVAMNARHYTAVCNRDESGVWVVSVPELRGVVTQARRLDQVRDLAADAIALWLNTQPESIDVELDVRLPKNYATLADRAVALRSQADQVHQQAAAATKQAAIQLVKEVGLTVRDAAEILGVSFQRVQQLVGKTSSTQAKSQRSVPQRKAGATRQGSAGREALARAKGARTAKKRAKVA